jgi:hypothetical protein
VVFLELFQQCGIFCFSFYYSLSSAILVYTTFVSDQLLTTPNFNNSWFSLDVLAPFTRYNIIWSSLLVTCGRSIVISGYSGFLHQW